MFPFRYVIKVKTTSNYIFVGHVLTTAFLFCYTMAQTRRMRFQSNIQTLKKCYLEVTQCRTSTWLSLGKGQILSDLSVCHLSGWWFRAVDTTSISPSYLAIVYSSQGSWVSGGRDGWFGVQMVQGRGGHCVCVWVMCREIFSILLVCSRGPSC